MFGGWGIRKFIISTLYLILSCKADDDKLYGLIDHITVNECQGVINQGSLSKDDIQIRDKDGNLALYFEAPNEYTVNVNNIKVKKPIPNPTGEIASTIQVPLWSAGSFELDWPYQACPQKKIFEGSHCDNESGVITDPTFRREYCRYCELCDAGTHAENRVDNERHHVAEKDRDNNIEKKCKQVDSQTYTIKKSIHIPGKKEIEQEANGNKDKVVDENLRKKIETGKGRLDIYLQIYSSDQPPDASVKWYANNRGCECCQKDQQGNNQCKPGGWGFFGSSNPCPKCNNNYAQTCMKGTPQKVACWTIEFHFRLTNKSSDVDEFKAQIEYNKNSKQPNYAQAETANVKGTGAGALAVGSGQKNKGRASPSSSSSSSGNSSGKPSCNSCNKDKCVAQISHQNTKNYCNSWWNTSNARKYCCSHCSSVCERD